MFVIFKLSFPYMFYVCKIWRPKHVVSYKYISNHNCQSLLTSVPKPDWRELINSSQGNKANTIKTAQGHDK